MVEVVSYYVVAKGTVKDWEAAIKKIKDGGVVTYMDGSRDDKGCIGEG